jgi:hypothetical protein
VLRRMIDRLAEIGRCYGIEINVRVSTEPSPLQIMIDHKRLENVEHFKCLGIMITNDARCTVKLNPGLQCQKHI